MIILPRQARYKHRETSQKKTVLLQAMKLVKATKKQLKAAKKAA